MGRRAEFGVGSFPSDEIAESGRQYVKQHGLYSPAYESAPSAVMSKRSSRALGEAYAKTPDWDEGSLPAYEAMRHETNRQFEHMTKPVRRGGLGISVHVVDREPYGEDDPNKIMHEVRQDVLGNRRMDIRSGASTGGHPFFSNEELERLRAVHDVYGHLGVGRGVDVHGEEAAWQRHASMYSPLARLPLATEFRGQTQFLNTYGKFPTQRTAIMPAHMQSPQFSRIGLTRNDVEDARLENRKQGLI